MLYFVSLLFYTCFHERFAHWFKEQEEWKQQIVISGFISASDPPRFREKHIWHEETLHISRDANQHRKLCSGAVTALKGVRTVQKSTLLRPTDLLVMVPSLGAVTVSPADWLLLSTGTRPPRRPVTLREQRMRRGGSELTEKRGLKTFWTSSKAHDISGRLVLLQLVTSKRLITKIVKPLFSGPVKILCCFCKIA